MEPRRGRRRVLTLSCIFGKEKNQEVLIFFFLVYFSCLEEMRKAQTLSKQRVGPRKSPFFFKASSSFYLAFSCLNNMIYCFIQHVSCFTLLLACSWLVSICFHVCSCVRSLFYMFYALCHALDAQIFSFSYVDVWVYMLTCLILCLQLCLAQIYMFVCMFYAPMPMSHMFVCLALCSSMLLCLHPHAQMYFYMPTCIFPCLYVQIGVFTCLN